MEVPASGRSCGCWSLKTVIIITGARDPGAAAEAMQSGAFAVIPKPFKTIYVENLVEAALEAG